MRKNQGGDEGGEEIERASGRRQGREAVTRPTPAMGKAQRMDYAFKVRLEDISLPLANSADVHFLLQKQGFSCWRS